mmetsp:Transcript_1741/g.3671  ORF Transcript_1741/g.3671 Transcript_1741/m.3671 type:complete len:86 (+) Transcript_1741:556-813(+)
MRRWRRRSRGRKRSEEKRRGVSSRQEYLHMQGYPRREKGCGVGVGANFPNTAFLYSSCIPHSHFAHLSTSAQARLFPCTLPPSPL